MPYMDLDTNSLEMLSSTGDLSCDVITPGDVINYADQLSDEIIEEVGGLNNYFEEGLFTVLFHFVCYGRKARRTRKNR